MKMKKMISFLMALCMVFGLCCAVSAEGASAADKTVYVENDPHVQEIGGDNRFKVITATGAGRPKRRQPSSG